MLRVLTAPRREFDVVSPRLSGELQEQGVLADGETVRVLREYRAYGVPEDLHGTVRDQVFADPATDEVFPSPEAAVSPVAATAPRGSGNRKGQLEAGAPADAPRGAVVALRVEYHRGQFDQRSDAAEQVLRILGVDGAQVCVAEVFVTVTARDPREVRRFLEAALVNPVDSEVVQRDTFCAGDSGSHEDSRADNHEDSHEGNHQEAHHEAPEQHQSIPREHHFSREDLAYVNRWFAREGREPTETELTVLETYWSDHCRHTTFRTALSQVTFSGDGADGAREAWQWYCEERRRRNEESRPATLMGLATAMMRWRRADGKLPDVVFSEEVNACTIRVPLRTSDGSQTPWLVLFKNETHNHPTEIEPYGGAATCLGGAIRDPLSGRGYVYQAMRVTGSADPRPGGAPAVPGKLLQRTITRGAARGYSSYGNQIGVATGLVDELYHAGYQAKRLEMGAVVGAVPEALVRREVPEPGDEVLLVGGRTGRDGVGGATGSSRSHDRTSLDRAGAEVQKGNPPVERALQRLFRMPEFLDCVRRCNDFGAGGVAVAVGEIAAGLEVELDRVPLKYAGLTPTEIAVSESQERMAVVVHPANRDLVIALAAAENLDATVIGTVTASPRLVMRHNGTFVVDLARDFLESAGVTGEVAAAVHLEAVRQDPARVPSERAASRNGKPASRSDRSLMEQLVATLQDLRTASREGLSEWFDNSIGSGTLLAHSGGRLQRSPVTAMAALLPAELHDSPGEPLTATVMAYGGDPDLLAEHPFRGAYLAVVESIARIAAAGVPEGREWLSLQEYFPRPGTDPRLWGLPVAALLGAMEAQRDLDVTAIGGKDSMSGTFEELQVPPTVISVALGVCEHREITASHATGPDTAMVLLYTPMDHRGVPDTRQFMEHRRRLTTLRDAGALRAAAPVRGAGALAAVVQMLFGEGLGLESSPMIEDAPVAAASYGSFIVELDRNHADEYLVHDEVHHWYHLGITTADGIVHLVGAHRTIGELYRLWRAPLESVFPATSPHGTDPPRQEERFFPGAMVRRHSAAYGRPRVVIPVFPGTNCEDDTARAFRQAGAHPEVLVLRTRTTADLEDSIETLARQLEGSQILMIPGGFSAGDEPGGSGKFIAAVLRAPAVRRIIERDFLGRDRLMMGICNGFQALVRLGLLPFGEYRDAREGSPVLAPNVAGRHVARMVLTSVRSSRGPWMASASPGDRHTVPVSHGEGRFWCDPALMEHLWSNGQVATQYVDWHGQVRMDHPWNPNGSMDAVEGIVSPDGRILGRMGHMERLHDRLYRHVPVVGEPRIFETGVAWFR